MSFTSPSFLPFILIVLGALPILRGRVRVYFLIAASYGFYSFGYLPWAGLLLISTVVDFSLARFIAAQETLAVRRAALIVSIVVNIGMLAFFKASGFWIGILNDAANALGTPTDWPTIDLALPLGISFFVFESLSYTVDVYRRRIPPCDSLADFALFICFFPHLVSGPIVRAGDFLPQIKSLRPLQPEDTIAGLELVAFGYFKKTVVADNCAPLVDMVYAAPGSFGGAAHWLAAVLFAVQIYADFSGYTDIARGLARIIGIRLCQNFNWPYLSLSIRDFWRRWHMSLSSWLRDYLYIPLGGSRRGLPRTIAALAATWLLGGLWHGMAAHFMVWGAYHGLMVSAGRYFETTAIRRRKPLPDWAKIACTFIIVVFGWVLFRTPSLDKAWIIWGRMLSPLGARFWDGVASFGWPVPAFLLLATAAHLLTYRLYGANPDRSLMLEWPYPLRLSTLAVLAIVCLVFSGDSRSFIYFQF